MPDPAPLRGKEGRGLGTSHVRVWPLHDAAMAAVSFLQLTTSQQNHASSNSRLVELAMPPSTPRFSLDSLAIRNCKLSFTLFSYCHPSLPRCKLNHAFSMSSSPFQIALPRLHTPPPVLFHGMASVLQASSVFTRTVCGGSRCTMTWFRFNVIGEISRVRSHHVA